MAPDLLTITVAVVPHIYRNMYQFICSGQNASDNGEVHRSFENGGSSVRILFLVTLRKRLEFEGGC